MTSPLYNKVRDAIVEAVPELKANGAWDEACMKLGLEDVLRAMNEKNFMIAVSCTGGFYNLISHEFFRENEINSIYWTHGKPLHEQDKPTIDFLHSVLCKEKTT